VHEGPEEIRPEPATIRDMTAETTAETTEIVDAPPPAQDEERTRERAKPSPGPLPRPRAAQAPADTEEELDEPPARPRRRIGLGPLGPLGPRWLVPAVAGVLVVVFAAGAIVLGWRLYQGRVRAQNRADVLRIVPKYGAQILSYDYRTLDANAASAHPLLTGGYRGTYDRSMAQYAAQYRKYHFAVKSTVASAGVISASGSSVTVVVFVDQTVTAQAPPAKGKAKPKGGSSSDQIRLRLTFQRQGGHWKVSKLDPL